MRADYIWKLGDRKVVGELKKPKNLHKIRDYLADYPNGFPLGRTESVPNYIKFVFMQVSLAYSSYSSDLAKFCSVPHF